MSNNIALVDPIAGGLSGKIPLPTGTDKAYMFLNGEGEFVPVDSEDTRFNTDKCKSIVIFTGEVGDYLSGDGTFQPTSSIQLKNLGDTSLSSDLTTGAILNYNGSSWANLNPGTDGYTLVSDSANVNKIIWQTSSKYVNVGSQSTNTTISLTGVSGTSNHILSKSNATITAAGLLSAASFSASTNIITNKFTGSAIRFSSLSANGVLINNASGVVTNKSYTSTNKNSVLMINNAGSAVDWLPTSSIHDNRITISGGNSITLKTGSTGHDNYFLNEQGEYIEPTVSSTDSRIAITGTTPITLSNQSTGDSNKFLNEQGNYSYPETEVVKVTESSISLIAGKVYIFSRAFTNNYSAEALLPSVCEGKITLLFQYSPGVNYTITLRAATGTKIFDVTSYNSAELGQDIYVYNLHSECYGMHVLYGGGSDGWYGSFGRAFIV